MIDTHDAGKDEPWLTGIRCSQWVTCCTYDFYLLCCSLYLRPVQRAGKMCRGLWMGGEKNSEKKLGEGVA